MAKPVYRVAIVLGGIVALALLLNAYSGVKGAIAEGMEEAGGLGLSGPVSEAGPSLGFPHSLGGNAATVQGMQGPTPASSQT